MDPAFKSQPRGASKNARYLCLCPKNSSGIHINIDELNDKSIELFYCIICFYQRAHMRHTFLYKVLVCISKDHPITCCLIERKILCCAEVIPPLKRIDPCSGLCCNRRCLIARSRIDDNHLVGKPLGGLQPAREIFGLIFCNHTGRNFHESTSFSSLALRWSAAIRSACARLSCAAPLFPK